MRTIKSPFAPLIYERVRLINKVFYKSFYEACLNRLFNEETTSFGASPS